MKLNYMGGTLVSFGYVVWYFVLDVGTYPSLLLGRPLDKLFQMTTVPRSKDYMFLCTSVTLPKDLLASKSHYFLNFLPITSKVNKSVKIRVGIGLGLGLGQALI